MRRRRTDQIRKTSKMPNVRNQTEDPARANSLMKAIQEKAKQRFRLFGYVGIILGVLFIGAGLFLLTISEEHPAPCFCIYLTYPYAIYSEGLIGTGIVLILIGLLSFFEARQEKASAEIPHQAEKTKINIFRMHKCSPSAVPEVTFTIFKRRTIMNCT
jgi:hypothetical protein